MHTPASSPLHNVLHAEAITHLLTITHNFKKGGSRHTFKTANWTDLLKQHCHVRDSVGSMDLHSGVTRVLPNAAQGKTAGDPAQGVSPGTLWGPWERCPWVVRAPGPAPSQCTFATVWVITVAAATVGLLSGESETGYLGP